MVSYILAALIPLLLPGGSSQVSQYLRIKFLKPFLLTDGISFLDCFVKLWEIKCWSLVSSQSWFCEMVWKFWFQFSSFVNKLELYWLVFSIDLSKFHKTNAKSDLIGLKEFFQNGHYQVLAGSLEPFERRRGNWAVNSYLKCPRLSLVEKFYKTFFL